MQTEKVFFVVGILTSILIVQTVGEYIWNSSEWVWIEKESNPNPITTYAGDEIDGSGEEIPRTRGNPLSSKSYFTYDTKVIKDYNDEEDYYEENQRDGSGGNIPQTTVKPGTSKSGAVANLDRGARGGNEQDESHLNLPAPTVPPTTRNSERTTTTTTTTNDLVHGLSNCNPSTTPKTNSSSASILAESGTAAVAGFAVLCAVLCVMFVAYRIRKKDKGGIEQILGQSAI